MARTEILNAVRDAGAAVVEVAFVTAPDHCTHLWIVVDDGRGTERVVSLVEALRPPAVLTAPGDEEAFPLVVIGQAPLHVVVTTQAGMDDALRDDDGDESEEENDADDGELWTRVDEAVEALVGIPLGQVEHRDVYKMRNLLIEHFARSSPELAERVADDAHRRRLWDSVNRAQAGIEDAHISSMRRDAHTWAERVYAADPVPSHSTKPVFRDAAYRYMKRIDEHCTSRIATEAIAIEPERVAADHSRSGAR